MNNDEIDSIISEEEPRSPDSTTSSSENDGFVDRDSSEEDIGDDDSDEEQKLEEEIQRLIKLDPQLATLRAPSHFTTSGQRRFASKIDELGEMELRHLGRKSLQRRRERFPDEENPVKKQRRILGKK